MARMTHMHSATKQGGPMAPPKNVAGGNMTKRACHQEQSNHDMNPHQVIRQHVPTAVKLGVAIVTAMGCLGLETQQLLGASFVGEIKDIRALALVDAGRVDFFTVIPIERIGSQGQRPY